MKNLAFHRLVTLKGDYTASSHHGTCTFLPFHSQDYKVRSRSAFKQKCISEAVRIGRIIICHLSKLYCVMWYFWWGCWGNLKFNTLRSGRVEYRCADCYCLFHGVCYPHQHSVDTPRLFWAVSRFHVDADTAESLSRQNSSSTDMSPTSSPTKRKSSKTLDEVHEKEDNSHNDTCTDTALSPSDADTENIEEVVKDLLEDVIEQVTEQTQRGNNVQCPQLLDCPVEESSNERSENTRMISPASEDSGISSPINRPGKTNDVDSTSVAQQDCHNEPLSKETCDGSSITNGQLCDGSKADLSHDSVLDSGVSNEVDRPRAPSLLASLSNEVKYWFGGKEKRRGRLLWCCLDVQGGCGDCQLIVSAS